MEIKKVTFFGSSILTPTDENFKAAKMVAGLMAESGRVVVNGGGPGIMLAATTGAKEKNGKTEVVYYRPELATDFVGEVAANYADKSYEEANYIYRTRRLLELGDAYIVFKGGTGTLSEFAMAWGVARLYIDHHKPLILYGKFWHNVMNDLKRNLLIDKKESNVYSIVQTPEDALDAIDKYENILIKAHHQHATCKGPECTLFIH